MNATESNRICVCCDSLFFPAKGDTCQRCEQRQADRLAGARLATWVIAALIVTILAAAQRMHGSVVDEAFLDSIAQRESRNNPRAVGKAGEKGAYQLKPIAVREVNRIYGTHYHFVDATNMVKSREIARLYLLICESRVRVKSQANVYARYRGMKR